MDSNTPTFTLLENVVIIGTDHSQTFSYFRTPIKTSRFAWHISRADYILSETTESISLWQGFSNFESYAERNYPQKVVGIEDKFSGDKRLELFRGYDFSGDIFNLYESLKYIQVAIASLMKTGKTFYHHSWEKDRLILGKVIYNSINQTPKANKKQKRSMKQFGNTLIKILGCIDNPSDFDSIRDYLNSYQESVRDYEIFFPESKRLCQELSGRKVIIVGDDHVEAIRRSLVGEKMERPDNWAEYFEYIPEKIKLKITKLEKIVSSIIKNK